jgi:uncharacterized alpha-E superfamily protein
MLSRVAEAIFWMSRYVERAENVARFVDVNMHLNLDIPADPFQQWLPLVTITGDHYLFRQQYDAASHENVLQFLTFDRDYPNSILSCLSAARENARTVREIISSEMWEQLNRIYLMVGSAARSTRPADLSHAFFDRVKLASHLFTGLAQDTMSHGEAWNFAQLGRLIERADKTSRILDVKYFILLPRAEYVGSPYDNIQWAAVLKSVSGLEMYRKKHHRITPANVSDFLIFDHCFPRAIRFCLNHARHCLLAISGNAEDQPGNPAETCLDQLLKRLHADRIESILEYGMHRYIDNFQTRLNNVGDAVSNTFFGSCPLSSAAAETTGGGLQTQ